MESVVVQLHSCIHSNVVSTRRAQPLIRRSVPLSGLRNLLGFAIRPERDRRLIQRVVHPHDDLDLQFRWGFPSSLPSRVCSGRRRTRTMTTTTMLWIRSPQLRRTPSLVDLLALLEARGAGAGSWAEWWDFTWYRTSNPRCAL